MTAIDEARISALGQSVDNTPSGLPLGPDRWRTTGPAHLHNALNTAAQGLGGDIDPVPNRAINKLYEELDTVDQATGAFVQRLNVAIGEEFSGGVDEATFNSIGTNIVRAVAGWTDDFTNSNAWTCAHNLHSQFVSVRAVKSDGTIMVPEIDYTNANQCILHFAGNVSGTAVIRR